MLLCVTQTSLELSSALAAFIAVVPLLHFDDDPLPILTDLTKVLSNHSL